MADISERTSGISLEDLRENYTHAALDEQNCETNPIAQFQKWFKEAQVAHLKEPNAMSLATVAPGGKPSSRIVLLKEITADGFVFYTNYTSRKALELETNPFVALTFYWAELERQVRVEGSIGKVDREKSERYFRRRPRGSKLGAWVSQQSNVVNNRKFLDDRLAELEAQYAGIEEIPAPPFWGGYQVLPTSVEFWQGRPNRLHDRIVYQKEGVDFWRLERLWP